MTVVDPRFIGRHHVVESESIILSDLTILPLGDRFAVVVMDLFHENLSHFFFTEEF